MLGLTKRQNECLDFIKRYMEHSNAAPSYREIGEAVGLASSSSTSRLIAGLRERGHLKRAIGRARSIALVGEPASDDEDEVSTSKLFYLTHPENGLIVANVQPSENGEIIRFGVSMQQLRKLLADGSAFALEESRGNPTQGKR